MSRWIFIVGCLVAAWLVLWAVLLVFAEHLRTDELAETLSTRDATLNLVLAIVVTFLFAAAVVAAGWSRRQ